MAQSVRVALSVLVAFVAGCAASRPSGVPARDLMVDSVPSGAEAMLPSGARCTTPCKVRVSAQAIVEIKFMRSGCLTQSQFVVPEASATRRDITTYALADRPLVADLVCGDSPVSAALPDITASAGP